MTEELAPPPEAERQARSTRDQAERIALALFVAYAASQVVPAPGLPGVPIPRAGRLAALAITDTDRRLLKHIVTVITDGIWRSVFGTRNVQKMARPGVEVPTNLARLTDEVYDEMLPGLEKDVIALRKHISRGKAVTPHNAATALATATYSSTAVKLAAKLPFPQSAKNRVLRKTWISRMDDRVRPLHLRLHGRTKRLSEDFWRWPHTGQVLGYPGDHRAPIEAWIGCRCIMVLHWTIDKDVTKQALGIDT